MTVPTVSGNPSSAIRTFVTASDDVLSIDARFTVGSVAETMALVRSTFTTVDHIASSSSSINLLREDFGFSASLG